MRLTESVQGEVRMADGTQREAYRNTYQDTEFHADGSFSATEETRIEFKLFGNINNTRGNGWRKASTKQADTFH